MTGEEAPSLFSLNDDQGFVPDQLQKNVIGHNHGQCRSHINSSCGFSDM